MTEHERPEIYIGGEEGGIGDSVFNQSGSGEVVGKSGHTISYDIHPNRVLFEGRDQGHYFHAEITGEGHLLLDVSNRDTGGNRNPDLYLKQLTLRTARHFHEQGYDIEEIHDAWQPALDEKISGNYVAYRENLGNIGKNVIADADRIEAAKNTWTGRIARELGLTEVKDLDATDWVTVVFGKPSPEIQQNISEPETTKDAPLQEDTSLEQPGTEELEVFDRAKVYPPSIDNENTGQDGFDDQEIDHSDELQGRDDNDDLDR